MRIEYTRYVNKKQKSYATICLRYKYFAIVSRNRAVYVSERRSSIGARAATEFKVTARGQVRGHGG